MADEAFRLFAPWRDPLDATGSFRSGGRWNTREKTAILYAASSLSLSLACLEVLVHLRNPANIPELSYVEIEIGDDHVCLWNSTYFGTVRGTEVVLTDEELPREIGDHWIAARAAQFKPSDFDIARAPSAIDCGPPGMELLD